MLVGSYLPGYFLVIHNYAPLVACWCVVIFGSGSGLAGHVQVHVLLAACVLQGTLHAAPASIIIGAYDCILYMYYYYCSL